MKGLIISGKFGEIRVRQKHGEQIELGELLIAENKDSKILMQAYDLEYGSQLSQSNLELVSGMKIEEDTDMEFMDEKIRSYTIALLKNLITITKKPHSSKALPDFFSEVREVKKEDLSFLTKPSNPLFVGNLRSGSKQLDFGIFLPGEKVFSHHILISATTGRGKSNLASVMLWDLLGKDYAGILVLDPHDEYYGRNRFGLKDHPSENLIYYSINPPPGAFTLKINIRQIKPSHFNGAADWSDPQKEALSAFYKKFKEKWIEAIITEQDTGSKFSEGTIAVIRRRLLNLLSLDFVDRNIICNGIFDVNSGLSTLNEICMNLERGKMVVIDTSIFSGNVEILIGSLISTEILNKYKHYKNSGELEGKPVVSIFLEEAPRVLGKEVLEKGQNIFSTIAREGRKFKVGLTAITQLPSLIPREILANMNTKIILGIEMQPERQAIIESAAQDLSSDSRAIASLDKGEAIITSNFTRFAIPVKIPLFEEFAKVDERKETKNSFEGINLG
ncbi:MAG: ATP-binding protein [Candidatus Woesearchaeota archaeon]|nr:ATP-binding protein [Candidatus Woesearchaeota archaeon]